MQESFVEAQRPGYSKRWLGLVFIGISVVVISLDNTVLNTALPSISRHLNATENDLQWIIDSYALVFAALLLTTGSIGDRYGRKKALQFGLVWFMICSVLAALVTSTTMLIALRAVLGLGGAMILPATLSIITATFPRSERPQAIALWAAIFGLGVGIGPVLGGFLLEHFDWNAVFLVNLPICLIALVGGALFLADSKDAHAPNIDWPGIALSIVGLFLFVHGIIDAGVHGWTDPVVLLPLVSGILVLAGFAWWESRSPNAMLPMRFFKNMSFSVASIALSLVTFCQFSLLFLLTPYLQTVHGYSTLQSGLGVLPLAITLTIMATVSARISARIGTKYTVSLGIAIAAIGYLFIAASYQVDTSYLVILIGQVIVGIGVGAAFSPAANSIMSAVPIAKAGVGSAMNDTSRQLGGALGVAVLGTVLNLSYASSLNALKNPAMSASVMAQSANSVQAAHQVADALSSNLRQVLLTASNQAYVTGMDHALIVGAIVLAVAALFVTVFLPAQIRYYDEIAAQRAAQVEFSTGD